MGKLDDGFVRNCKEPGIYGDGRGSRGLQLVVEKRAGVEEIKTVRDVNRRWRQRLRVKVDGEMKPMDYGLGSYPRLSLAEARKIALANGAVADLGGVPGESEDPGVPSFQTVAEQFFTEHYLDDDHAPRNHQKHTPFSR